MTSAAHQCVEVLSQLQGALETDGAQSRKADHSMQQLLFDAFEFAVRMSAMLVMEGLSRYLIYTVNASSNLQAGITQQTNVRIA